MDLSTRQIKPEVQHIFDFQSEQATGSKLCTNHRLLLCSSWRFKSKSTSSFLQLAIVLHYFWGYRLRGTTHLPLFKRQFEIWSHLIAYIENPLLCTIGQRICNCLLFKKYGIAVVYLTAWVLKTHSGIANQLLKKTACHFCDIGNTDKTYTKRKFGVLIVMNYIWCWQDYTRVPSCFRDYFW